MAKTPQPEPEPEIKRAQRFAPNVIEFNPTVVFVTMRLVPHPNDAYIHLRRAYADVITNVALV
jgi:hypothetical protein